MNYAKRASEQIERGFFYSFILKIAENKIKSNESAKIQRNDRERERIKKGGNEHKNVNKYSSSETLTKIQYKRH